MLPIFGFREIVINFRFSRFLLYICVVREFLYIYIFVFREMCYIFSCFGKLLCSVKSGAKFYCFCTWCFRNRTLICCCLIEKFSKLLRHWYSPAIVWRDESGVCSNPVRNISFDKKNCIVGGPDPVGSELKQNTETEKSFRIRTATDWKWIISETSKYSKKLTKFDNFSTTILNFLSKEISLKNLYLFIIFNLTHLQDGSTQIKFILRILQKIHYDPDPKPTKK